MRRERRKISRLLKLPIPVNTWPRCFEGAFNKLFDTITLVFKKLFILLALVVAFHFVPVTAVHAAGEFSTNYVANYDVDTAGVTQVSEKITLTNLTDKYYASEFSLTIGSTKITDISAADDSGDLVTSVNQEGNKSKITIKFPSQITGKNKTYSWTLKFKSTDFAQAQGKVWQVSIPKIASVSDVASYDLTLSVPAEFGDPSSILPEPKQETEDGGKISLTFDKSQLTDSGILANFGTNQLFSYTLHYHLTNPGILPIVAKVPLPPDTEYQEVAINSISPKPETVTIDADGNYIAWFKLEHRANLDVSVGGLAKLSLNSRQKLPYLLSKERQIELTSSQEYWQKDDPLIQTELSEILKGHENDSVKDKARLINNFVVNTLKYDEDKLKNADFSRLGAITALNHPDKALCSEFTDLFIALARAAGIPSREVDGYAYTPNKDIRPLSFNGTVLHAWPEYYDPQLGWIMIDPTWQNTTGGVDYFSKFDLNHFVLDIRGSSSVDPTTADDVKVDFSDAEFSPHPDFSLDIDAPYQIFAGFPAQAIVSIVNGGSSVSPATVLALNTGGINISGENSYNIPPVPPFGKLSYKFDLRTRSLIDSFDQQLTASIADKNAQKSIQVRPFFAFQFFPVMLIVVTAVMISFYLGAIGLHIKRIRRHRSH